MGYSFYISPQDYSTAERNGISARLLTDRVRVWGWDKRKAMINKPKKQTPRKEWLDIARVNGISTASFYKRVNNGMSPEKASTIPLMDKETKINNMAAVKRKYPKAYEDTAVANGISKKTFVTRMRRGWSAFRAATTPVRRYPTKRDLGRDDEK